MDVIGDKKILCGREVIIVGEADKKALFQSFPRTWEPHVIPCGLAASVDFRENLWQYVYFSKIVIILKNLRYVVTNTVIM